MNENIDPALPLNEETENKQEQAEVTTEPQVSEAKTFTKEEIIKSLQELSAKTEVPTRADVDNLKQSFYKLKSTENETLKEQFVADGGDINSFVLPSDPLEEEFKILLNTIKERRAKALADEEKVKEDNLLKKERIIEAIKNLTESTDDFNKLYKEFKDLQQQWNEIKLIPAAKVNEIWKAYQLHSEKFYDLIKINNEFRDYDFKKNLEIKTGICEVVEKLQEESDVVSAFHQLQNFHQQWREIGPVAKEFRDEIWERFKAASTEINKKHQSHFEELKGQEENNLTEKTAICDTLKAIDYSQLKNFKDWDEKSHEIIALQAKWKTIGFVPKKVNSQIFEQYRALCDTFFEKKAEFFKHQKDDMEENLNKKRALCEKAEALKDSTDWRKTTDELIAIQKEWKTIGAVPRKYSDAIWKQFVTACDYFFEQKNSNTSSQKEEEVANLAKKKEIIEKVNALSEQTDLADPMGTLRELMDEWHQVGFVPFKEKDKIYKEYQAALDVQFDRLKMDKSERRLQSFKSNVDDIAKSERPKGRLFRERDKLMHQFNKVKSDLQTYENNMGFLSISKGASGLLKDMEHKIQDLKNELELIAQKIETIDTNLNSID
ncbi:DUF349 domain-containing protein [Dysgonomonas sp. GY617]|uniref:DUF349 domain-containing protein n=1 Tax=Dysgonomonas sp. GY617 TaxID=2780420 RepID=UPI00188461B4|nr:DUF349 domain-containing protein [Dysgonomonas sp. GY617]MBF0575633.1 DUF349 domain-containing protein [Dysgonomonas sp. GY617]